MVTSLFTCLLLWTAPPAAAQDSTAEARHEFELGTAAYEEGRFEEALERFERSYELVGTAELMFNIASAADRLRRDELALEWYERYVAASPESDERTHVEGRIAALRASLEEDDPPEETLPVEETVPGAPEPSADESGWLFTWVALAAAGALLVGSIAAWVVANNEFDDLSARCQPTNGCDPEVVDASSGQDAQLAGNVLFGASLAAFSAAAVLFFVEGSF